MSLEPDLEFSKIVDGNFCSGCGACAIVTRNRIANAMTDDGTYRPDITNASKADLVAAARVCPFSSHGPDEDELAAQLFPGLPAHQSIGRHDLCLVGHVADDGYRQRGSSGGLISWIAETLLDRQLVDGVVHVRPCSDSTDGLLIEYALSTDSAALRDGAKSHYYPIEMSRLLNQLRSVPGKRYAFTGVPCFIKALRRLASVDPDIGAMVGPTIGLVCGHLKSTGFAEFLAWQVGIDRDQLARLDFRHKLPDRPASRYGMEALAKDGRREMRPMTELMGRDWGQGWFRLEACDYCDDVLAETADIAIGDAWLPGWVDDWQGTNVVIARSALMRSLIEDGLRSGQIAFQPISPDEVAQSQAGGLRDRREALAHRLAMARQAGRWVPAKRVAPALVADRRRRRLVELRASIARQTRIAYRQARATGDFSIIPQMLQPLLDREHRLTRQPWLLRLKARAGRFLRRLRR